MKRFAFRLDRVLAVRRFELEKARVMLAAAESEATRLSAVVALAQRRLADGRRLLAEATEVGVDGSQLALQAQAVRAGRMNWLLARQAADAFEPTRVKAREQVRRRRARVESLEKLRERRASLHRQQALAAEQAEIEGLAIARWARARALGWLLIAVLGATPLSAHAEAKADAAKGGHGAASGASAPATGHGESKASASTHGEKPGEQKRGPHGDGSGAALPDATAALLSGPGFSKGVDLILMQVRTRETDLARRELEIVERENAVKELEAMVAQRAGELEKIRAEVEARITSWSGQGQDRIEQLSGVYAAMPPREAAALLGRLDLDLAVSVIRKMKKKISASVLAEMKPDRALLVSRRILEPLDPATDGPPARAY